MSKIVDSIIGHAIGDAMGVPTEFCAREQLLNNPVTEMIESPQINQPAGSWSDDTSMEIATIESFVENNFWDFNDIMNKWTEWLFDGKFTANGQAFDVGRTCMKAINKYIHGVDPIICGVAAENANGNGALMRILPVALYSYYAGLREEKIIELVNDISGLTHRHSISKLGCYIYVRYVMLLLGGVDKKVAYELLKLFNYSYYDDYALSKYDRILKGDITELGIDDISSSGYVVDTLECAMWIFLKANNYEETIVASTNIGDDTDTIGAIAGSMAGIVYGMDTIPARWLDKLLQKEYLIDLAVKFDNKINTSFAE